MQANRPLTDIHDDLLAACVCIGVLADHIAEHGLKDQVLINLERAMDGLRRLMVERRTLGGTV
ncbi:hypothetical protein ABQJ54_02105 [Rhodanobacter sp. Si-c]|uniref:Uncharacterized protein n=1 Tax=Rhodanobacter lycopersici TaxID=3162487 RepID=A0ABV3Q9P1_9GAMM